MKKLNFKPLLRHCVTVLFAFATMGLLASMALNLSFLNPVAQTMKGFSLTDIYYHVMAEYGERDTSRVITIVDMTELVNRADIADVLAQIEDAKPKVIGVDIVFEGWKPDSVADMYLSEVAHSYDNIIFSYRMLNYVNDTVGYTQELHSFFTEVAPVNEGFTNYERNLYGGLKRKSNLRRICNGEMRTSFVQEVAMKYTDGQLSNHQSDDLNINFRPTVFRVISPDSIAAHRDWIEDHVVLFGATHELADMHYTPLGEIAGIELLGYSLQTMFEQTEVRYPDLWVTIVLSFFIVLITFLWRRHYMLWAKNRKSEWLRFFLTTTFVVGSMLFLWSTILVGIGFITFYITGISINLGWAMAAIPFLGGADEFFRLTTRRFFGSLTIL